MGADSSGIAHPGEGRDPDRRALTYDIGASLYFGTETYDLGPGIRRDERGQRVVSSSTPSPFAIPECKLKMTDRSR
jgi:hypothetical protein